MLFRQSHGIKSQQKRSTYSDNSNNTSQQQKETGEMNYILEGSLLHMENKM